MAVFGIWGRPLHLDVEKRNSILCYLPAGPWAQQAYMFVICWALGPGPSSSRKTKKKQEEIRENFLAGQN
jgi:hypothetical protein